MRRFLVLTILAMFGMQDSDLWAKTQEGGTQVTIRTSMGTIRAVLYDATPLHRDNFVRLAESGAYNGVLFHRVIKDFMIQAGDPTSRMTLYTAVYGAHDAAEPVPAEILPEFFHRRGALAAARKGDEVNPHRESSGSQFYIVTGAVQSDSTLNALMERTGAIIPFERAEVYKTEGGTPHLDGAYTIFGQVTRGMRVVERIEALPTDNRDRPRRDVYIKSITVHERK